VRPARTLHFLAYYLVQRLTSMEWLALKLAQAGGELKLAKAGAACAR
jgi:hypothetical protein